MADVFKTKKFEGWLKLNWKSGTMDIYKREKKKRDAILDPAVITIKIDIDVNMPVLKQQEIKGKITIPDAQVKLMMAQALEEDDD